MIIETFITLSIWLAYKLLSPIDYMLAGLGITMNSDVQAGIAIIADYVVYFLGLLGDPGVWLAGLIPGIISFWLACGLLRFYLWLIRFPLMLLKYIMGFMMIGRLTKM